jgi:CheY-like chemotaxis protein
MERSQLRVVIVDDNRDATALLGRLLELAGYSVVAQLCDSIAAIDSIAREKPHVVILDIAMPLLDGCTLARRVRESIVPAQLLIALSGYGTTDDKARAIEAGFNYHLTKPADWPQIDEILTQHTRTLEPTN